MRPAFNRSGGRLGASARWPALAACLLGLGASPGPMAQGLPEAAANGAAQWHEPHGASCPSSSVQSGTVCVDKYEASVWSIPPSRQRLIDKVLDGSVTRQELLAGGAQQRGVSAADLAPDCAYTGSGCTHVYAVSIPGVSPSAYLNWFQSAAACRNAGKRLPTNAEWQVAALGTPDPAYDDGATTCNIFSEHVTPTGSRKACRSDVGAFDMVGNVWELTADWTAQTLTQGCASLFDTNDFMQMCPAPVAIMRGGGTSNASGAGVFALWAGAQLTDIPVGFRCVGKLTSR